MTTFSDIHRSADFDRTAFSISGAEAFRYASRPVPGESFPSLYDSHNVESALARADGTLDEQDFAALLSPAAHPYLEAMAQKARDLTRRRFGRVVQLYAPMYLSNECRSSCTYCGFSYENKVPRLTLTLDEIEAEAEVLYESGIRHILLLTGEDYKRTPVEFIGEAVGRLSRKFPSISIEVYPLKTEEYDFLRTKGVDGLAVYQETYDPVRYREVHLRGMKKRMDYRLDCPDRAGQAGFRKIALGSLLGLSDPAADTFFAGMHARYIMKNFWQTQVSLSLPRLRPADHVPDFPTVPDSMYARFIFALRLFLPDAGLILSTRESPRMRDGLARISITQMSAGSKTEPGGYSGSGALEQFTIQDERSVAAVSQMLRDAQLEPVFVDWASVMK